MRALPRRVATLCCGLVLGAGNAGCDPVLVGRRGDSDLLVLAVDASTPREVPDRESDHGGGLQLVPNPDGALPTTEEGLLCKPCEGPEHCGGEPNYCMANQYTGEHVCGRDCAGTRSCPAGYTCLDVPSNLGAPIPQCAPLEGTCQRRPAVDPLTPGSCGNALESELVALVNALRADRGLQTLTCDERAAYAAHAYSQQMCDTGHFSHIDPHGRGPDARLSAAGVTYQAYGENIAAGATTAQRVLQQWLDSPGHRTVLLGAQWTHTGAGYAPCAAGAMRTYWSQLFFEK